MTPKTPAYPATPLPHNTAYKYLNGVIVTTKTGTTNRPFGTLYTCDGDVALGRATEQEQADSIKASMGDGGIGAILVDGERCYVQD